MNDWTYDSPMLITYGLKAASVAAAAELLDLVGPVGLQGRVVAINTVITTATTVAVSDLSVGITGTLKKFATQVIAVLVVDSVVNAFTNFASDSNLMPADTRAVISSGGGATAGIVDFTILIGWF